jgi:hypothetical protein
MAPFITGPDTPFGEHSLISLTNMTQKSRILERLKSGEWLSSVEASRDMYIMRLGARIWDLRADGYTIMERRVAGKSFSEYKLIPAVAPVLPPPFKEIPLPPKQNVEAKSQMLFQ